MEAFLRLKEAALENWKAKLGSLIVAVIFFFYVQYTRNVTRVIHVKVDLPAVPEHLVLNSRIPSFVKVEFFGPQEVMDFNASNFKIVLVNPGPGPGENRYRLDLLPRPPEGIEARYDEDMTVILDRLLERTLPLVGDFQLSSGTNLRIGSTSIVPETIRLRGPAGVLNMMDRVNLNPLRITPGGPEYATRVLVSTLPEFVTLSDDQPYEIDVRLKLLDSTIGETLPDVHSKELSVACENVLPGLKLDESPTVKVLYRSDVAIPEGRLTAYTYCSVFLDANTRSILPSSRIPGMPVYIKDALSQKDVEILEISPAVVNLQFSMQRVRPPTQVQKGLEEHLIR